MGKEGSLYLQPRESLFIVLGFVGINWFVFFLKHWNSAAAASLQAHLKIHSTNLQEERV